MDPNTITELLECSVCLETLDTSSKVLPCQHTFCKKCLEEILNTHKELRCPECRILVEVKIDDLPPNVLLMRILEGMRNAVPGKRTSSRQQQNHGSSGLKHSSRTHANNIPLNQRHERSTKSSNLLYAKALYDYSSKEPGDLSFKKGDVVVLRKKIDSNWYHGESCGKVGAFPLSYVQVIGPLNSSLPQCKAICAFKIVYGNGADDGYLSFKGGDIISVIRRIDETWAEGRLGDKIGIFPLTFVDLSNVGKLLPTPLPINFVPPQDLKIALPATTTVSQTSLPKVLHSANQVMACSGAGQVVSQECRAKCSFKLVSEADEGFLNFNEGDNIAIIRKIDETWAEGKIGDKLGVFPLSYVELGTSTKLMQNTPVQAGPSRMTSGATPDAASLVSPFSVPGITNVSKTSAFDIASSPLPQCVAHYDFKISSEDVEKEGCLTFNEGDIITVFRRVDENWAEGKLGDRIGIFPLAFVELNSMAAALMKYSISPHAGPSRTVITSGEGSTTAAPQTSNLEVSGPPPTTVNPPTTTSSGIPSDSSTTSLTSPSSSSSATTPSSSSTPSSPASPQAVPPPPPPPNKRHSFGSINQAPGLQKSNRHSAEILSLQDSSGQPHSLPLDISTHPPVVPALERHPSQRHKRSASSDAPSVPGSRHLPTVPQLPASYVALFPYKPKKPDELELKRGAAYTVIEMCQDGWFKGIATRNLKCGVFPGNYVAPAKSLPALQAQVRGICRSNCSSGPGSPRNGAPPVEPRNTPPPPYNRTFPVQDVHSFSKATSNSNFESDVRRNSYDSPSTAVIPPPNVSVHSSMSVGKSAEKVCAKDKKEKCSSGVSLMRRLASIKKSKSPPPIASYSMDNPVFEDSSAPNHPVHIRSGSCPNQLLGSTPHELTPSHTNHRVFSPSSSHRTKYKERPSLPRTSQRGADLGSSSSSNLVQHRKSHSLDTSAFLEPGNALSASQSPNKTVSVQHQIKERFRCIVPYPPNSEYELELKLGDIIYVHKKRDDGWYKGTQQRTGRTGLFPASFVQSF